ncbi:MAG: TRAP transporter small permease subunit [Desulfobulbaceae bacterium]|jgi:TRAP-type C4-dicarboxylate transport system permease small subunit|nr:TRAP transporter small permease subunit [Desulfobulbaceae bacterium]MDY0352025.1 TRAP transporter small permease subunit [Desulfobulbaceae bacterium]
MNVADAGRKLWRAWTGLTNGLLCLLLLVMIGLACTQIFLRTFLSGGLLWADPLLRYLVLWSGMIGAVVATREGKHIAIDVITYLAPEALGKWIQPVVNLFSAAVAAVLTLAASIFIRNEALFGSPSLLGVPSWIWNLIFPLAFAMITFHFLAALLADLPALFRRRDRRAGDAAAARE